MAQEIKLKVSMHSKKCRTQVMKAVAQLTGVDKVSVDLEKEMVVVIGDVDPVSVATRLRKKRKVAEIVSVRPHKNKGKDFAKIYESTPNAIVYSNAPFYGGYEHAVHGGGCNIL